MHIIKKLREEKGITQAELSKHLKISPSTVGMYEQGRRESDIDTLKKITVKSKTLVSKQKKAHALEINLMHGLKILPLYYII